MASFESILISLLNWRSAHFILVIKSLCCTQKKNVGSFPQPCVIWPVPACSLLRIWAVSSAWSMVFLGLCLAAASPNLWGEDSIVWVGLALLLVIILSHSGFQQPHVTCSCTFCCVFVCWRPPSTFDVSPLRAAATAVCPAPGTEKLLSHCLLNEWMILQHSPLYNVWPGSLDTHLFGKSTSKGSFSFPFFFFFCHCCVGTGSSGSQKMPRQW